MELSRASPVIETARLTLRPPRAEDFAPWAEFQADPVATRHLGGPQPPSVAWRTLVAMAGAWSLFGFGMFSVIDRASGSWLGRLGPWRPDGWPGPEIGWGIVTAAEGKGIAYEGASAAIDWALEVLGWDEFIHCIEAGNTRSEALARRLGSQPRGRARLPAPIGVEVNLWGQSRREWRARRAERPG